MQQFRQCRGPCLMHSRTDDGFDSFEVEPAGLAPALKDRVQQSVYFAGNFLLDRFSRFFSCDRGTASWIGRSRQIWVLISTNC